TRRNRGDGGARTRQDGRVNQVTISDEDRRILGAWAAGSAERVLALFEEQAPTDSRPREAIEGIRAYARGELRKGPLRSLATAALAAAREVGDPAAAAAARAAGYAAASPYIHALASADQTKHALGPAMQAARAGELAAGGDPAAGDEEIRRAVGQAPPEVRHIVRQMPVFTPGRSRLDALRGQLEAALRGTGHDGHPEGQVKSAP
ncbi:putative immunity protein, partial [Streptomyces sp. NPDC059564]|uniref:putative immunity protein n=1 Tax=Streptomyces sp. NPDC059564 TaxID=3346865 RepID=UPI00367FBB10